MSGGCSRHLLTVVESSWNVMAHGDLRVGKWRGNWRMEWVASTLHPTSDTHPALLPLMRTPRLPVVDWTDAPADLNGLVRFAKRRNLVSARVPSHFKRSLQQFHSPGRRKTCGSTWPYHPSRTSRAMCCLVGWDFPASRKGSRGPVRLASIRHQVAAQSSGRVRTSAAFPPGGAGTHHTGASSRPQCDCPHGTPAIIKRNFWHYFTVF